MTKDEWDFVNWRIDQLHKMMVDLANRLGQYDFAENSIKFHNKEGEGE